MVRYTYTWICRSLTRYSATCHLNFFPNPNDIDDAFERVIVSEDDVARRQIEEDLRLYGSRPEPPDTVEVDEYSQLANLPPKRSASDFEAAVDRPAKLRKKSESKEFNYQALTVMDWNSAASPLDAWLNQSAGPSPSAALDRQESTNPVSDPLTQESDEIKVFRNVHMVIAPSPERKDPPLELVEGLDFGAQIYYRNIMDRYPVIPKYLARRLAQANYVRAERLRNKKERLQREHEVLRNDIDRPRDESKERDRIREVEYRRTDQTRHTVKRQPEPKERGRAENIEQLNLQKQVLQEMINEYKTDGFVMLSLNNNSERGFTSRAENPAFLDFWERRNLPSRYLKIEDMEQAVRGLEADMQYYDREKAPPNANDHSWRSFQSQQASPNRLSTPPPPVDFWTRRRQSSRPASVHSRSSSMNSSLRGRPAFDPQEQDPTFASDLPDSKIDRTGPSPVLPPAPVELGRVTTFNCDICGQEIKVKRRREWQ